MIKKFWGLSYKICEEYEKMEDVHRKLYQKAPFDIAFCPYRVSPLGAHIDHQYGKINGLAINKGIHIVYHPKQMALWKFNVEFSQESTVFVNAVPKKNRAIGQTI